MFVHVFLPLIHISHYGNFFCCRSVLFGEITQITAHECNGVGVHSHKGFVAAQPSTTTSAPMRYLLRYSNNLAATRPTRK